jgi:hypothetical protein
MQSVFERPKLFDELLNRLRIAPAKRLSQCCGLPIRSIHQQFAPEDHSIDIYGPDPQKDARRSAKSVGGNFKGGFVWKLIFENWILIGF